jgi:hypothetical protein
MSDEILNEQQAAQFLGVTVHALRAWRWRKSSDGPTFLKMGSCVRYRTRDLEAYQESHAVSHAKSRNVQPRSRRRARRAA